MYIMYFCDWAIGLSGSTLVCMRPRFELCRTVMKVVVALTATVRKMTIATCKGTCWCEKSRLSLRWTPRIVATRALSTVEMFRPYFSGVPGFQSAMARSTLNSA